MHEYRIRRSDVYILFTDETNTSPTEKIKFFVYGGLFFEIDKLKTLHNKISLIRHKYKYQPSDILKFDTHKRPEHLSIEEATEAKKEVINACIDIDSKFIVYVVHHNIIGSTNKEEEFLWSVIHIIGKFNQFISLPDYDEGGIVVVDRLPVKGDYKFLSDKFTHGLDFHDGNTLNLSNIYLLTSSCINASHASSAMDIVLGSVRYCINEPCNTDVAKEMMKNIFRLIWHNRNGNKLMYQELGLMLRPKEIRNPKYKEDYDLLLEQLDSLLI